MSGPARKARRAATRKTESPQEGAANSNLARASQLGYKAQLAAGADGCDCRACAFLREMGGLILDEEAKGGSVNGPGDDPSP